MKVIINSLSDKKVSYKIYDYDGKRRRLLARGRMLHSAEREIEPQHGKIIVRISRSVSPLSFLYVWFILVAEAIADLYFSRHKLNYLWEIEIGSLKEGDTVEVVYTNATPETGMYYGSDRRLGEPDALYCTSHPCKKVTTFIRRQTWLGTFVAVMSAVLIVSAICLIFFNCTGA